MKVQIDGLIVVEGTTDVQKLLPWIDAEFITTNGSALSQDTLDFIRAFKATGKEVIVLMDPDYPGDKIRTQLNQAIPGLTHVYLEKQYAIAKNKVGVAQAKPSYLLQSLKHKISEKPHKSPTIILTDLIDLGLVGVPEAALKRDKVSQAFHLGNCNVKTMLKRLNQLGISFKDIQKIL